MTAYDIIKVNGVNQVKDMLEQGGWEGTMFGEALKRIVDSHEIVEKHKGLHNIKAVMLGVKILVDANNSNYTDYELRILKAIDDVEKCL